MNPVCKVTLIGCVDGRTTSPNSVVMIHDAVQRLAKEAGIAEEGELVLWDMIRVPGPSPLLAMDPEGMERDTHEVMSSIQWIDTLIDVHTGELVIIAGHQGACAMENGADIHDPGICIRHLYSACKTIHDMYQNNLEDPNARRVIVAGQIWKRSSRTRAATSLLRRKPKCSRLAPERSRHPSSSGWRVSFYHVNIL